MAEFSSYPHGTPNWIDLMAPDPQAAKAFYTGLFGWTAGEDQTDDEGNYIYTELYKDGKVVAGLGPQMGEMEGMPPVWNTYVCVDDCDQVVKNVEAAGGQVMMPSMDVFQAGRMAIFSDPTGAVISAWQPNEHQGAALANEPGTWSWNELMTRDVEAAKAFYSEVFGWTWETMDMGDMGHYHVVEGGENGGLAGAMAMPDGVPDQVPNYWGVYFTVANADETVAKAQELGATVQNGPMDTPVGRLATLADPNGGSFSIMQHPPAE